MKRIKWNLSDRCLLFSYWRIYQIVHSSFKESEEKKNFELSIYFCLNCKSSKFITFFGASFTSRFCFQVSFKREKKHVLIGIVALIGIVILIGIFVLIGIVVLIGLVFLTGIVVAENVTKETGIFFFQNNLLQ